MARILVTPEQVYQVANKFRNASQQSQQMVTSLDGALNTLAPNWDGMTKQRFYSDYQSWKNNMRNYVQLLEQISQELNAIGKRFEAADQQR